MNLKTNLLTAFLGTFLFFNLGYSQQTYFKQYQSLADSLENVYKIPSAVILAIAYHESAGGNSKVAKLLNNHFGIKGKNNLMQTHNVKSAYKYYESVKHSYIGFCNLVSSKKYYANVKSSTECKKWVTSIASAGYAANAERWTNSIMGVIQKYNLN